MSRKIKYVPSYDELYDMYISQNLSKKEICEHFNFSKTTIDRILCKYKIRRSIEQEVANRKKTMLERYGVDVPAKSKVFLDKMKETNLKRHGVEYTAMLPHVKAKRENTMTERYGVKHQAHSKKVQEKRKSTNKEKYGVEHPSQSKNILNKMKKTTLIRHGVEHAAQSNKFKQKSYNTKKKNGTFNTSSPEEYIYTQLLTKYPEVKRQYSSKVYPFACDFYIPELEIYIEFQGYWSHGGKPYLNDDYCNKTLLCWRERSKAGNNTGSYIGAIHVWTVTDPLKRETAKKNNLNWIEFFSLKDFDVWFNSL